VILSFTIRPFPNWGWVLISGIVGILRSLYLWASLPVTALRHSAHLRRARSWLSGLAGTFKLTFCAIVTGGAKSAAD